MCEYLEQLNLISPNPSHTPEKKKQRKYVKQGYPEFRFRLI